VRTWLVHRRNPLCQQVFFCWVERICLGWHLVCVLFYTQVIKLANSHLSTGPPESPPKLRVSDPHWFNADPDPDPAFFLIADPDSGSGSRVWWPKIDKKYTAGNQIFILLIKNCHLLIPGPP
jgi:hypothetical protein